MCLHACRGGGGGTKDLFTVGNEKDGRGEVKNAPCVILVEKRVMGSGIDSVR